MPPITASVEIKRSPQDVFLYIADPTQRPNWQDAEHIEVVRTTPEGVGTRVRETRRVQGSSRTFTWEVTEYDPGRRYAIRGIDGPIRARVPLMNLTAVDQGAKTRVAIEITFDRVGIGKMLVPLVRRGASKEVGSDGEHLKNQLEAGLT